MITAEIMQDAWKRVEEMLDNEEMSPDLTAKALSISSDDVVELCADVMEKSGIPTILLYAIPNISHLCFAFFFIGVVAGRMEAVENVK